MSSILRSDVLSEAGGAADRPRSLIEATYQRLSADIVHGHHAPGAKLRLEQLGLAYEVSVGTVREALSLLVSDGLVVSQAQRGFRVASMSQDDFTDLTRTRILLECQALRDSIRFGGDEWEGRVVNAFHRLTLAEQRLQSDPKDAFDEWEARNRAFHDSLVSACPSKWSLRFRNILYRQAERYRRLTVVSRSDPGETAHREHENIFKLVLGRDEEGSVSALVAHIESSLKFSQSNDLLPARDEVLSDIYDVEK